MQTQQDGLDVVRSSPLILQDIQANTAGEVDIGVVDWGLEENGWWGVGVVGWESEGELEGKTSVRSVVGALNRSSPREEVTIGGGEGRDTGCGGRHELHQLGLQSW